jgi:hypothetical protein
VRAFLGYFFSAALVSFLLFVLGVIVRFSFLGAARTRGWRQRLRRPEMAAVEAKWGVKLSPSVEAFFRSDIVERCDFSLARPGAPQSEWWHIERFIPLTRRDLTEWIAATGVPGIPIALDGEKGTYYIPFEPIRRHSPFPVLLRLPGVKKEDRVVARTFDEFTKLEARNSPDGTDV